MGIDNKDMDAILERTDERYVKKIDLAEEMAAINNKFANDDKRLAVIEFQQKLNNWLTAAIASGIIALVIKVFIGG